MEIMQGAEAGDFKSNEKRKSISKLTSDSGAFLADSAFFMNLPDLGGILQDLKMKRALWIQVCTFQRLINIK